MDFEADNQDVLDLVAIGLSDGVLRISLKESGLNVANLKARIGLKKLKNLEVKKAAKVSAESLELSADAHI